MFVLRLVKVKEESMKPSLNENDILLIKTNIKISSLKINDIIILKSPIDQSLKLIKRIKGKPGDFIQITNNAVVVLHEINRGKLESDSQLNDEWIEYEWILNSHEFIVLSDNKLKTYDSRRFGPINSKDIIGKAILSIRPLKRFN